jgi:ankyrin repeat protein
MGMMKKSNVIKRSAILSMVLIGLFASANLFAQEIELFTKVRANNIDAVKTLIAAGADVNQEDDMMGFTPLALAIWNNNSEIVQLLISNKANINYRSKKRGLTPLMEALNLNHIDLAKLLIDRGADINIKSNDGSTALIFAAGRSKEAVELLLSKGADINVRNNNNLGVFTNCVMGLFVGYVSYDLAELLLEKGADINEENTNEYMAGETPIFLVAGEDNEELIKFLIKNGANVNAKSKEGKTPLSIATEAGNANIIELLKASGAK